MSVSGLVLGGMASAMGGGFICLVLGHPFIDGTEFEILGMTVGSFAASLLVWRKLGLFRQQTDIPPSFHSSDDQERAP